MQALLVVVVVLLVLTLVSLWVVMYQLVKQQGRLVLRQDELEDDGGLRHEWVLRVV